MAVYDVLSAESFLEYAFLRWILAPAAKPDIVGQVKPQYEVTWAGHTGVRFLASLPWLALAWLFLLMNCSFAVSHTRTCIPLITACFLTVKLSREEALFSHSSPLAQKERRFIPGMNDQGFPARFAVIIFSSLLAWIVPDVTISFSSNAEIASRINPGLFALLTALGAGAAGAFIISRSEIADSIGGVAIAISLVPPLCVVGIALRQGQLDAAVEASLLFMTNFLAILLAGGLALVILGLGQSAVLQEQVRFRRRGLILFFVCILLVTIPLSLTAYQRIIVAKENNNATVEVQKWLQGTSYQVDMVNVNDHAVIVTVEGTGQLKSLQQLANQLAATLGRPILVNLRTFPAQMSESRSP